MTTCSPFAALLPLVTAASAVNEVYADSATHLPLAVDMDIGQKLPDRRSRQTRRVAAIQSRVANNLTCPW